MLPKAFGIGNAVRAALLRAPALHGFHVLIHAMMLEQPVALAGVSGQHRRLRVHDAGDVDGKTRWDRPAEQVLAFNRIAVVKVRDMGQRRCLAAVAKEVWNRRAESGGAGQRAGHLMIKHVIRRTVGQDKRRPHFAQQADDTLESTFAVEDEQVAFLEAMIAAAD